MTANELMIGDWVKNMVHNTYFKVDIDALRLLPEWPLEPIPLTPEILEKNGFIYTRVNNWYGECFDRWDYYTNFLKITVKTNGKRWVLLAENSGHLIIDEAEIYVHQLQHFLGQFPPEWIGDLADNFKI